MLPCADLVRCEERGFPIPIPSTTPAEARRLRPAAARFEITPACRWPTKSILFPKKQDGICQGKMPVA